MKKFPRTPHMPGSKYTPDDIHLEYSYGGEVIATEKMDGSNICMNNKRYQTRSGKVPANSWSYPLINYHYQVKDLIPEGVWILGEFMFHRKSIAYENLPSVFIMFGAVKGNKVLSWSETIELSEKTGIPLVKVLARGSYADVVAQCKAEMNEEMEGFVVRPVDDFSWQDYSSIVTKFVGSHHNPVATNNGLNSFA